MGLDRQLLETRVENGVDGCGCCDGTIGELLGVGEGAVESGAAAVGFVVVLRRLQSEGGERFERKRDGRGATGYERSGKGVDLVLFRSVISKVENESKDVMDDLRNQEEYQRPMEMEIRQSKLGYTMNGGFQR